MKNKKLYITLSSFFFVATALFVNVAFFCVKKSSIETVDIAIIGSVGFALLTISEVMLIKSGVVPKFVRFLMYWQWFWSPIALIIFWVYVLSGGR